MSSRRKGARTENEIARILGAEKISRSGHTGPDLLWRGRYGESKAKKGADGFKLLYRWLRDVQFLVVKAPYKSWLVVMPVDGLLDLLDEEYDRAWNTGWDAARGQGDDR